MTNTIQYRGAQMNIEDFRGARTAQLEQQQGARQIQYRGAQADVARNAHRARKVQVTYRGATAEVEL